MENSSELQLSPKVPWTSSIAGTVYARHNGIHNAIIRRSSQYRDFQWTPLLDKCFESIKVLAARAPILKPVDFSNNEPVWVITDTDGSKTGVSVVYGQGKSWEQCCPARFLSKKFPNAQHVYHTHEHETNAVLEALMKWEDKLLGLKFALVTDHKGLEYFKTQPVL